MANMRDMTSRCSCAFVAVSNWSCCCTYSICLCGRCVSVVQDSRKDSFTCTPSPSCIRGATGQPAPGEGQAKPPCMSLVQMYILQIIRMLVMSASSLSVRAIHQQNYQFLTCCRPSLQHGLRNHRGLGRMVKQHVIRSKKVEAPRYCCSMPHQYVSSHHN